MPPEDFLPEVCKEKHKNLDKDIKEIEDEQKEIVKQNNKIKLELEGIRKDNKNNYNNIKSKIVLTEKSIGNKIDKLNNFDDTLKGNGNPGIQENIRTIKKDVRNLRWVIIGFIVLLIGGRFIGFNLEQLDNFWKKLTKPKEVKIEIVDPNKQSHNLYNPYDASINIEDYNLIGIEIKEN
jgi:hypothetical protein